MLYAFEYAIIAEGLFLGKKSIRLSSLHKLRVYWFLKDADALQNIKGNGTL